ncbi:MAG: tRNA pseudouridine(13) synthase TruD [Pseudomonadota bacterium]
MTRALEAALVHREWKDLTPIPGRLKSRPEDFQVEEVLGRDAAGQGEYLWVEVEKTGLSMEQLFRALAEGLDIRTADVGHAGLKDRHAVTRQTLSVPARIEERLGGFTHDAIRLLGWARHPGPLHVGQLSGNRFKILLRGQNQDRLEDAREWARRIQTRGAPNGFGKQRFGVNLETLRLGLTMVREELSVSGMGRMKRRLAISAVQSHLFNLYLLRRMEHGILRTVIEGDLLQRKGKSRFYPAVDLPEEQAAYDRGHLRITGPLFGGEDGRAAGEAGQLELEVLQDAGLSMQHLQRYHSIQRGGRRALVVSPRDLTVEEDPHGLRFNFFLPKGCYATEIIGQLMAHPI